MKTVKPKGDRLNWIPIEEYTPVKLTRLNVRGKQVDIKINHSAFGKKSFILIP